MTQYEYANHLVYLLCPHLDTLPKNMVDEIWALPNEYGMEVKVDLPGAREQTKQGGEQ